ncbi:unnamed protein product [Ambrosiozyma monospora]|uniref:Unnamed protein product n=1 Tax=Ambrosiozyma monospora TaxID=43982 RepID=A0ACB5SYW0_AMBMO|nr:unnamed protein product [Ambrosiozyma monospora]
MVSFRAFLSAAAFNDLIQWESNVPDNCYINYQSISNSTGHFLLTQFVDEDDRVIGQYLVEAQRRPADYSSEITVNDQFPSYAYTVQPTMQFYYQAGS